MRRAILVFGPFVLFAGAVFACEDDSGLPSSPTFLLDGSTATFDGNQAPFDGAAPDAEEDAEPDAPVVIPAVSVTVVGKTGPSADVRVVFHDADGAVLETKLTGADGKATRSAGAAPAMASALLAVAGQRQIMTWTGVEDGDQLVVRDLEPYEETSGGSFAVALPGAFSDAGASGYEIVAGECFTFTESSQTATLPLMPYCTRGAKSSVLVRAKSYEGELVGHSFSKGNNVPTNGATVAVATGVWRVPASVTLSVSNVPPDTEGNAELLEISDGHGYPSGSVGLSQPATLQTATGFADALQATASISSGQQGWAKRVIAKRGAPAASITLDAALFLPPISGAEISANDAARPVVSWTSTSTAAADGGLVRVRYYTADETSSSWTFVVAPGSTSVKAPAMPAEAESFLPDPTNDSPSRFSRPTVVFIEADTIPSYALFRRTQSAIADYAFPFASYALPPLPTNGTYRATAFSQGEVR
ncbi:MAG: hypothetical protein KF795_30690 [Labilithrix sp.]|nr:hypothetical protein [Labilithrix sp.]